LSHARLGLRDGTLRLQHRRPRLAVVEDHQNVAGFHRLALRYGHVGDDTGNLARYVDSVGCLDVTARHYALDEIRLHHGQCVGVGPHHDARPQQPRCREHCGQQQQQLPPASGESRQPRQQHPLQGRFLEQPRQGDGVVVVVLWLVEHLQLRDTGLLRQVQKAPCRSRRVNP